MYTATKGSEVDKFIREICGKGSEEAARVEAELWAIWEKTWLATDRSRGPRQANEAAHNARIEAFNKWAAQQAEVARMNCPGCNKQMEWKRKGGTGPWCTDCNIYSFPIWQGNTLVGEFYKGWQTPSMALIKTIPWEDVLHPKEKEGKR
jgi:hypothetical protein